MLSKESEERIGLVNSDLAERALKEGLGVRLNGESGWRVTMIWTAHAYWEKDLEQAGEWVHLRRIMNIELEDSHA
jgi:hypothetical protein